MQVLADSQHCRSYQVYAGVSLAALKGGNITLRTTRHGFCTGPKGLTSRDNCLRTLDEELFFPQGRPGEVGVHPGERC